MPDFLLELRSEEIPARMQAKAEADLARLFAEQLGSAGLYSQGLQTYATPRRLALIARGLPETTQPVREETKGPRSAAPPQALEGFLRKTGLRPDQLEERDGILYAVVEKPGRATADVLAQAIPAIVRAFPWPKSMRWGPASIDTASPRWVRPLQGVVALLGEEIVPVEIAGITSGAATIGHRFHHPGVITIGSANDYVEKLRACHVIVDPAERRRIIADGAARLAADAGLQLVEDEGLVAENAGLTEWPVPLLGRFDAAFLDVPSEVVQLTARVNQKYFVCRTGDGAPADAFICTANIEAADGGLRVVAGNERVLAARLADAKFFWEADLKVPLEKQAEKLGQIVFHEKLGTVADKVERVAKLARWLVEEGIVAERSSPGRGGGSPPKAVVEGAPHLAERAENPLHQPAAGPPPRPGEDLAHLAHRAALLCKADLVTGMVGEFPELQGIIGGHLARAQGEPAAIAEAIRDHYKPVGQGDEVPTAPVTVAVSLADKLDTIAGFFAVDEQPTGSRDPFALRRSATGIVSLLLTTRSRASIEAVLNHSTVEYVEQATDKVKALQLKVSAGEIRAEIKQEVQDTIIGGPIIKDAIADNRTVAATRIQVNRLFERIAIFSDLEHAQACIARAGTFLVDRLKVQQREAGVRHDLIDAVFALGGEDDLVRLLARVRALQGFVETAEGADLLAGYKRAANILKKEGWASSPSPLVGEGRVGGTAASAAEKTLAAIGNGQSLSAADAAGPRPSPPHEGEGEKGLSYTPETEEAALIAVLDSAEPRARAAVEAEDFEAAMAALATLRGPVDAFFDKVTVNDPDRTKREARLALLARMRDAVHRVADFSRIEG